MKLHDEKVADAMAEVTADDVKDGHVLLRAGKKRLFRFDVAFCGGRLVIDLSRSEDFIGLGVAGNFAGHLEQAGEASDFAGVEAADGAPKGVFPWFVRGSDGPLAVNPLSSTEIRLPTDAAATCQIEPELALWCELAYDDAGAVASVTPTHFGAFNDCSWRERPGATPGDPGSVKISHKKHWGPASQGFASDQVLPMDTPETAATLDRYRLASFLVREGETHAYGEDAPVAGYGYFDGRLLGWLIETLNTQKDSGPLEDAAALLATAGRPARALIAIGATRYLPFGETTFLRPGDEAVVIAYDGERHTRRRGGRRHRRRSVAAGRRLGAPPAGDTAGERVRRPGWPKPPGRLTLSPLRLPPVLPRLSPILERRKRLELSTFSLEG